MNGRSTSAHKNIHSLFNCHDLSRVMNLYLELLVNMTLFCLSFCFVILFISSWILKIMRLEQWISNECNVWFYDHLFDYQNIWTFSKRNLLSKWATALNMVITKYNHFKMNSFQFRLTVLLKYCAHTLSSISKLFFFFSLNFVDHFHNECISFWTGESFKLVYINWF